MKIQSLFLVSIICFFCAGVFAEETAPVTGLCKDGTPYTGKSKRGACRGHDGVKEWYGDKDATAPASATPTAAPAPATTQPTTQPTASSTANATATGVCNDGTAYTGKSKRGACRGHKGVKEWYADTAPTAQTAPATPPAQTAPAPAVAAPAPAAVAPASTSTPPSPAPTAPTAAASAKPATAVPVQMPPAGSGKVWVNTRSKIYHCEGTKYFGKTKDGEFMTEADAQAKGYVANRKKICNK